MINSINSVIEQLKALFADKGELRGLDDWDHLIGCIVVLQQVAQELQMQVAESPDEGVKDIGGQENI